MDIELNMVWVPLCFFAFYKKKIEEKIVTSIPCYILMDITGHDNRS